VCEYVGGSTNILTAFVMPHAAAEEDNAGVEDSMGIKCPLTET
jgi:hypothetical protein